ncbi:hypothetical protein ASG92_10530 [Arthrobacter sp. Soil736]|uniref:RDD family protein n=1 Tax=Arthrobacter sp. Soil736 TaxID=1736395 RepID=UPI0007000C87|nr:RDD family protein [Arthrobacter sp. Soil736]KRE47651.1 hypothetical protein ASG92_10530 [Arthrobacter sp. Soil736]
MPASESNYVSWPSHLFAGLIDAVAFWTLPVLAVTLGADRNGQGAMLLPAAAWVVLLLIFWAMHAKGHTPGSAVSGFRFLTWKNRLPGAKYGLALVLVRVVAPPLWVAVAVIVSVPGGGPLPGLEGFPMIGERTGRRRFLEAADDYWERWS